MPNRSEITTPPPAVIARSKATKQSTVATQQAAMIATLLWDPVLARFRTALAAACTCGDRIERVVLFGSRACGDHQPDTDYDIAVFIKDPDTFGEDAGRLARVTTDILLERGSFKLHTQPRGNSSRTPWP
jgi:predicted nucleotidyltransferase